MGQRGSSWTCRTQAGICKNKRRIEICSEHQSITYQFPKQVMRFLLYSTFLLQTTFHVCEVGGVISVYSNNNNLLQHIQFLKYIDLFRKPEEN